MDIFSDKNDCMDFLNRLKALCVSKAMSVYAWSLMSNHFHLLVRTGNTPLSNNMGSKKRGVVKCRKIFCQIAVKKMGYSGADVARFLGVTTSAVNRLASAERLSDIERYT